MGLVLVCIQVSFCATPRPTALDPPLFYPKCEKKSLVSCMTNQMVSLDNLGGLVSFFGFRGVNIPKVKNPGKCHDLERTCKMLIQEWAGWGHFHGVLDVQTNRGGQSL